MRRLILLPLLVTIAVVGIVGGIGVWVFNEFNFYTTNDALVEGKVDAVNAPQAGILTNLNVKKGDTVWAGNQIATLNLAGNNGGSQVNINSPANGTILLTAAQGAVVTPGYPIAIVSEPGGAAVGDATVVVFVDEGVLSKMRIGQRADVSIDAYGGTTYLGHVQQIVREAASQFSQVPSQDNASGNFTKVSQRVPVLIALDPGTTGNDLLPGLSAEVTIHFYV